jgi:hypothetical protein
MGAFGWCAGVPVQFSGANDALPVRWIRSGSDSAVHRLTKIDVLKA